jgi:hypothetical protein
VVVIGAGLGGLCTGALLSRYGKRVLVCESHSVAGGAAHTFKRAGFHFESGPSLFSQLLDKPSDNPLAQVLQAVGDDTLRVHRYNTWHVHIPEGSFVTNVGDDQFLDCLRKYVDADAAKEWTQLVSDMRPLSVASTSIPAAAARADAFALFSLGRFLPRLLSSGDTASAVPYLLRPFSAYLRDRTAVKHPFLLKWLDLLCFLLSGAPADGTAAAEIGFMFQDWYRPGSCLEYPIGGSQAIVDALVKGLVRHGGQLKLNTHVDSILVDGFGRANGVALRGGAIVRAKQAVISNASCWDTLRLLPANARGRDEFAQSAESTAMCDSFMHLHLGIDATGLDAKSLEMHHISLDEWDVTAPQNLVLVCIASIADPSLAPPGCHVIHAYTPATEPWEVWKDVQPGTPEYEALKEQRSQVLWRAVEKAIPDVRSRVKVQMVGTPHTHGRYLRRTQGTYGGTGWLSGLSDGGSPPLPTAFTPVEGLLCVGDSLFPGPGVPAVAASSLSAAHALVGPMEQCAMLDSVLPR